MNRHANWIFEVKDKIHPINPKAFIVEHFYPEVHNLQDASKFDGQKNRDTVVHLKSGLACVAIFGESPDFRWTTVIHDIKYLYDIKINAMLSSGFLSGKHARWRFLVLDCFPGFTEFRSKPLYPPVGRYQSLQIILGHERTKLKI